MSGSVALEASGGASWWRPEHRRFRLPAAVALGDWFEFTIGPPVMDLTAAPYGGARYPVEARMDERIFARFHLDAGVGDVVMRPLETIVCRDWLEFAGIESSRVLMIAREQQFAEKIHAYTLPPERGEQQGEGLGGSGSSDRIRWVGYAADYGSIASDL